MIKYAVIYAESIYHEADQRSKDYPGHGYPAYTSTYDAIKFFESKDALIEWCLGPYAKTSYKAIQFEELQVLKNITLEVKKL